MKTIISITGQINGNYTLRNALPDFQSESKGMFNSIALTYNSKRDAVKAIRAAYKSICNDEPGIKGKIGGVTVAKDRSAIYYDASQAVIEPLN